MWKYYKDVSLYALAICCFIGIASSGAYASLSGGFLNVLLLFGVFGTGLGALAFTYFQKNQYYLYHNLGFTKKELIVKTWLVNFGLAAFGALVIQPFI